MSAPAPQFRALGVPADLCAVLDHIGIHTPSPVQAVVLADAIAGRDVAGRAPTGSGKTLAFGLPLVARLTPAGRRRPTALILSPTRELAGQIATELRPFVRQRGHDLVSVYGGVGYGPQRTALGRGTELLVACPGRLEDLLANGDVDLGDVGIVVVDEADRMADMGFLPAVRRIVGRTRADRQVLLFSATFDRAVATLSKELQRDPVRHEIGPKEPDVSNAQHVFWTLPSADRLATTASTITALGSTIVFCRTRHGADRVVRQLARLGTSAAALHGGRSQSQRDRALQAFARGEIQSLIATDVAARGVHVDGVAAVVHFDLPADAATYIHRSGRTARAGATGVVVSLVDEAATKDARALQRGVGIEAAITPVRFGDITDAATADRATVDARRAVVATEPERRERAPRRDDVRTRDGRARNRPHAGRGDARNERRGGDERRPRSQDSTDVRSRDDRRPAGDRTPRRGGPGGAPASRGPGGERRRPARNAAGRRGPRSSSRAR